MFLVLGVSLTALEVPLECYPDEGTALQALRGMLQSQDIAREEDVPTNSQG